MIVCLLDDLKLKTKKKYLNSKRREMKIIICLNRLFFFPEIFRNLNKYLISYLDTNKFLQSYKEN